MNIKSIIEREGIKLVQDGRYLVGKSPFTTSRLPLLVVDEENQTFTCMGSGISGDAISFIENLKGISKESAELQVNGGTRPAETEEERLLKKICSDANKYYKEKIKKSKAANEYLESRGFSKEEIETFDFGYAPNYGNSLYKHLLQTYKREDILKTGVCKVDKEGKTVDLLWKRITIPIRNSDGDVIAFGGRVLDNGTPKYINSPETPIFRKREILYGYNVAKDSKCNAYIICEGYMDCISLHKAGLINAVASLGTALTKAQCELLTNKKRVYVLYDTDTAGINATKKAVPLLEKIGLETRIIDYSPYKDPDEFIRKEGVDNFRELFKEYDQGERFIVEKLIEEDVKKAVRYLNMMSTDKIIDLTRKENRYV